MEIFSDLMESQFLMVLFALMLGASIGSFLNVVIHRLPIMMYKEWISQCNDIQKDPFLSDLPEENISLASPGSHCPSCKSPIHPLHNIPVLGYLMLAAKCKSCGTSINPRYFIVEICCGLLSAYIVYLFGVSIEALFVALLTFMLVPLIFIDIQHRLLPDNITYALLWSGVLFSLLGFGVELRDSIIGVIAGYSSLWSVYILFKLATGKEGMGHGDFKLLSALGAWVGWQQLLPVILISSVTGTILVLAAILIKGKKEIEAIPFGPFLAIGGWITFMWGKDLTHLYFSIM